MVTVIYVFFSKYMVFYNHQSRGFFERISIARVGGELRYADDQCFSLDWIFSRKVWNLLEDISINSDFNRDRKKN